MQNTIKQYRNLNPDIPEGGFFLFWDWRIYGWQKDLRDPSNEKPGAKAVSENGEVFIAKGGDDIRGADRWEKA